MNQKLFFVVLAALIAVGAAGLIGGPMDVDINEQRVQEALRFAVVQHNQRSNAIYLSEVAKVIKVQQQVVAGMKYIFTVEMAKTPCKKDGPEQVCLIHQDPALAQPYQCKFAVVIQPWLNSIRLVEHTC